MSEAPRPPAPARIPSRGTEGWPTDQLRYGATGRSLSRIPNAECVPTATVETRDAVPKGYRAAYPDRESVWMKDQTYWSRNTLRCPRRAPDSPGGGVSGDFEPCGAAGSGALRSAAASRTALTRATRSSALGSGGPDGSASRSTSHPRGTVRFSAWGAHRSYECGSA